MIRIEPAAHRSRFGDEAGRGAESALTPVGAAAMMVPMSQYGGATGGLPEPSPVVEEPRRGVEPDA